MKIRLTRSANRDIDAILTASKRLFGPRQAERYADVIETGIAMVAENPNRPGSSNWLERGVDVRRFHLQFAAKRQGGAAHVLFYLPPMGARDNAELLILRVLGDEMEPHGRVAYALRRSDG